MRERPVKGQMIVGGDCPVERGPFIRRDSIQKGAFLVGGPAGPVMMAKSSNPPVRYGEPPTPSLDDIRKRMDALDVKIKQVDAAVHRVRS